MTAEYRTVTITATASVTIRETWTVKVPADGLVVDWDTADDLLDDPGKFGAEFVSVTDESLGDEHDRTIESITEEDPDA